MLNQKGMTGISLREIARKIGVGHNAPYRHFKNKQQLIEAIAEDGFRRLKAKNTRLELEFAGDPEEQVFESAMHVINIAAEQPNVYQLMFGGSLLLSECGMELKNAADEAMQSMVKIIRNGQQHQIFIAGDPIKLALSTMSMIQGLAVMVSSGKLRPQLKNDESQCVWTNQQTLLRGMVLQLFDVFLRGIKTSQKA